MDDIYFVDFQKDLATVIASLDIVILPSLFQDPSPLVCLESMAISKLVVASEVGGIPELLQNGRGGVLFEPGNVEALSSAVVEILDNPNKKDRIQREARRIIDESFGMSSYCNNMENLYLRILKPGVSS